MIARHTRFPVVRAVSVVLAAGVVAISAGPAWAQFNPLRQFPATSDGIPVFVAQLPRARIGPWS